jgi:precorrin-2 dehydrogenase/sirohydrochlorin ferrochelatase
MMAASYTLCRMEEYVMAPNPGFPLVLDVKGFSVLVIGGDEEAADKSQRLLESGARVTVISPTLHETLKLLAASAKVIHRGRHFRETDLEHTILVLNTIRGDRDFARMLLAKAREKGFLLWSVDMPELSSVTMPAVVAVGHARVAISSSGVAPALSGFMKEDLERILDSEFSAFVDWLGHLREQAKANEPDADKRRALLREALDGFRLLGKVQYPKVWQDERARQTAAAAPAAKTT